MNYYPFHIGDYASHTRGLSLMEDLAYRRLIDEYYLAERPFNGRLTDVARLIGMADHIEAVEYIMQRYFEHDGDSWVHSRIEIELETFRKKQADASKAGQASAAARKNKGSQTDAQQAFNSRSTVVQRSSTNQEPITNNQKEIPPTPRKRVGGQRFEEFWLSWPKNERKQDKAKCIDHWKRNELDALADAILDDVRTKRGTKKWNEGFVEAPLVYLRGKRWMDGVVPEAEGGTEAMDWRSTQSGIRSKGIEVGVGDWDEQAFQGGRGEHFPAYRAKVEAKVREAEQAAVDPQGRRRITDLVTQAMGA